MKANFCVQCINYDKINMLDGYCILHRISVSYDHTCDDFSEKKADNMTKEILLCDNCRFADYKDNNDNFYCSLYDQQFFADPKHLVCEHHSYYCQGFDSPRYVK